MTDASPRYFNRELSWLEFNERVLEEARDDSNLPLERLKFLAITGSNLDEFFMVRVGGLTLLAEGGVVSADPAGMTPRQQLEAITDRAGRMLADQYECFSTQLEPLLAEAGIRRVAPADYTQRQARNLERYVADEILSVLTPMAVRGEGDFPQLVNQMLCVCVRLKPAQGGDKPRFALIPFGRSAHRFVTVHAEKGFAYTLLEDVVARFLHLFFPGEETVECVPFRITRNADMGVRDDLAADLMTEIEEALDARKQSACVRLEIAAHASPTTRQFLQQALCVGDAAVYPCPGPIDLSAFMRLAELSGFDQLRNPPWPGQTPPRLDPGKSMFQAISRGDVLLIHPYDSFEPVVRLIEEAAEDPDVLAIKQTLYRTSRNSPIVAALEKAAERGKNVTAIVELKARFDEARNIEWARNLERAEVQVIYGVKGLKTHAKVCIIVRREPQGIQRYVHFGTGNYNESTARLYSDVSLMTCDEELGADAVSFFNAVTGYSQPQRFRKLEAAPIGLREKLLEMIEAETQRKREGQPARIAAKLNSLVDPKIIDALYAASQAGVEIKLNIRGVCCLRPGVPGLSENIEVLSIVDRFLEHARIIHFHHGGDERVFISSADWMPRNLDRRVELLVPVEDPAARNSLIDALEIYFRDTAKARRLLPSGLYERVQPRNRRRSFRSQERLYRRAVAAVRLAKQSQRTVFEPHLGASGGKSV